ncbi:dynein light chain Tctex-type 1-like isoform X2 [Megalops cyprinoides]|uniref:dynein light chain Tctex-type 1-like isoform X2 n=1 Tax=Megalops cyprinoides TaxID=118141 RepID=UPI001865040A|nr:dynein light chain Tctex-type 1-like isoform X2 [Megalops cyprinoides]
MDEFQSTEEAVETTIGNNAYQHNRINQWTSSVVETSLNQLTKLGKPFKYIVTCIILQKNGAGLHTASSCFWDNTTDGKHGRGTLLDISSLTSVLELHSEVGEQDHVLHRQCVWPGNLSSSSALLMLLSPWSCAALL